MNPVFSGTFSASPVVGSVNRFSGSTIQHSTQMTDTFAVQFGSQDDELRQKLITLVSSGKVESIREFFKQFPDVAIDDAVIKAAESREDVASRILVLVALLREQTQRNAARA